MRRFIGRLICLLFKHKWEYDVRDDAKYGSLSDDVV